ncbi:hypothetical protein M758_9G005700 [Ceratodon purpureus]|nr:hypothetical protein M758_9G005700 [Ceratodon purpureus]
MSSTCSRPSTCSRLEQERQKREKYLQRKVQETLSLSPPPQPIPDKGCAHGAYSVSSEELKAQSRAYQEKLRLNRILQVRAQEMLFASKRIAEFRDRKTKDSKILINHLKEVWSKDQRRRIASLEEEFANACQSIGLSHDAALLVERNKAAKEELMARQAEESRYWDTLRFEEAMQKVALKR